MSAILDHARALAQPSKPQVVAAQMAVALAASVDEAAASASAASEFSVSPCELRVSDHLPSMAAMNELLSKTARIACDHSPARVQEDGKRVDLAGTASDDLTFPGGVYPARCRVGHKSIFCAINTAILGDWGMAVRREEACDRSARSVWRLVLRRRSFAAIFRLCWPSRLTRQPSLIRRSSSFNLAEQSG